MFKKFAGLFSGKKPQPPQINSVPSVTVSPPSKPKVTVSPPAKPKVTVSPPTKPKDTTEQTSVSVPVGYAYGSKRKLVGALHSQGLTNKEIVDKSGLTLRAVHNHMSILGLSANKMSARVKILHDQGLTNKEISNSTGISVGAVTGHLSRQNLKANTGDGATGVAEVADMTKEIVNSYKGGMCLSELYHAYPDVSEIAIRKMVKHVDKIEVAISRYTSKTNIQRIEEIASSLNVSLDTLIQEIQNRASPSFKFKEQSRQQHVIIFKQHKPQNIDNWRSVVSHYLAKGVRLYTEPWKTFDNVKGDNFNKWKASYL